MSALPKVDGEPRLSLVARTSKRLAPKLSGTELQALQAWARSKKLTDNAAAAELLAFALTELRSRARSDSTRPQLMGEAAAKTFAPMVYEALRAVWKSDAPWLHVDYAKGSVVTAKANPGGKKGHVFLDARPANRPEWCDTANVLTPSSVMARLIGSARPVGVSS